MKHEQFVKESDEDREIPSSPGRSFGDRALGFAKGLGIGAAVVVGAPVIGAVAAYQALKDRTGHEPTDEEVAMEQERMQQEAWRKHEEEAKLSPVRDEEGMKADQIEEQRKSLSIAESHEVEHEEVPVRERLFV